MRVDDETNLGQGWHLAETRHSPFRPTHRGCRDIQELFERIHESSALPNLNQTAAAIIVAHAFLTLLLSPEQ